MNKPTFTQGPWIVKRDKHGYPYIGVESDPYTYQGTVATVNQRKDARLIAAAPEMHAALKAVLPILESCAICSSGIKPIREILAKVEGEK